MWQAYRRRARAALMRSAQATIVALSASFAAPLLFSVEPAHAQCTGLTFGGDTVTCSGSQTTTLGLGFEGNVVLTVQDRADITVGAGFNAIRLGSNVAITNSGSIIGGVNGVYAFGISDLTNSGNINGGSEDGVFAFIATVLNNSDSISGSDDGIEVGTLTSLINSGIIRGSTGEGIDSTTITSLTNSGSIHGGTSGIDVNTITTLINTGTINGSSNNGVDANTIYALINSGAIGGDDNGIEATNILSLTNTGAIIGRTVSGISTRNTINALFNNGTISGINNGIVAAEIEVLINSGTIAGGVMAISETGGISNTDLTLNAGSVLIGLIDLGGGANTLNIGAGRSINSRFDTDNGITTLPSLGTLAGHLVAFSDSLGSTDQRQVVAIDPSAFASFDDALAALTSGIGQTVQGRQAALRSDPTLGFASSFASRYAAAQETSLAAFSDLDLDDTPLLNPNRVWIEGFGAYREDESDRVGSTFESLTGGLVAGVDVPLDAITSVGVMAGFAASTSQNEIDTQETDTRSYYAGVYASTEALGLAWDASLTVGHTSYDAERITANNLVANGLETARADFGGWFINPQVTATNSIPTGFTSTTMGFGLRAVEQSLTLSYAGLFLDGYTETGTTNPLTLDARALHLASARAALALPFERIATDGALTTLRLIGGIEARTQFGDDTVSGTLLGQTVSAALDGDDSTFGGFLGLSGEYQTTSGLTAYANAEGLLETNSAYQISANAGLRIAF